MGKTIVDTMFNSGNGIAGKVLTAIGVSAASAVGAIFVRKMGEKMASTIISSMKDYKGTPEETKKAAADMATEMVDLYKKYLKPKNK